MKRCRICGELKPLEDFHRAAGMRDGHRNECKPCFSAMAKDRYDSKAAVARARRWQQANREKHTAYQAEYRNRPERKRAARDAYYRRTFGITADDVDAMLERQGGGCAICGDLPERLGNLHVDHDHATGVIRGLLCSRCNHAIGLLREDAGLFARAAEYLAAAR
jgi:hypothetical protein